MDRCESSLWKLCSSRLRPCEVTRFRHCEWPQQWQDDSLSLKCFTQTGFRPASNLEVNPRWWPRMAVYLSEILSTSPTVNPDETHSSSSVEKKHYKLTVEIIGTIDLMTDFFMRYIEYNDKTTWKNSLFFSLQGWSWDFSIILSTALVETKIPQQLFAMKYDIHGPQMINSDIGGHLTFPLARAAGLHFKWVWSEMFWQLDCHEISFNLMNCDKFGWSLIFLLSAIIRSNI